MERNEETEPGIDPRRYAAIAFALAVARGALYAVRTGDLRDAEFSEILTGTSSHHIAQALSLTEEDLFVDWEQHLTPEERDAIQSGRLPERR